MTPCFPQGTGSRPQPARCGSNPRLQLPGDAPTTQDKHAPASLFPPAHPSSLSTPRAAGSPQDEVPAHLGVSLLLPHEAVRGQPQLGHARVPRVLHQRPDLVRPGDVVRGAGTGKGKAGSEQAVRDVWLCHPAVLSPSHPPTLRRSQDSLLKSCDSTLKSSLLLVLLGFLGWFLSPGMLSSNAAAGCR